MSKLAPQRTALVRAFERRFGKAAGYSFSRSGTLYGVQDTATGTRLTGRFSAAGRLTVVSAYAYAPEPVAPPPAAPVASDPVPADVPCYLAVSYHDGAETVLGVFRVAEHGSAQAAEEEASKLCDRIRAAAPGARCDARPAGGAENAAANAALQASAIVPLGGRYVALADGGVEWVADAPTMVPQPAQQQQGRDMRRGMARCEVPGEWQIGIWCVTRQSGGTWEARATGPGTIGDGSPHSYPTLAAAYLGLTGEPMPGAASPAMVPQPCQPQQARARAIQPPRGERRYVTVRDTETGDVHRVLTSVARVGFAVVVFVPSNRHRQGALGGMLITHDDTRKAWVFNDEAEARHMLSRNRAPGERVIPAELVSDPAI